MQDETEELEREKEMTLVEGARERLLIMERVESLSQLYLGGLEEVRQDLGHVKFSCSERVEEIETQLNDFKRNPGITCEEGSPLLPRQVIMHRMMLIDVLMMYQPLSSKILVSKTHLSLHSIQNLSQALL